MTVFCCLVNKVFEHILGSWYINQNYRETQFVHLGECGRRSKSLFLSDEVLTSVS